MKRLPCALIVASIVMSSLCAQELSTEELRRATDHLTKTRAAFLAAVEGLSEAQLNFKPEPARWSVAEVAEHVAAAEDMLLGLIEKQVLQAPARTETVDVKEIDDYILATISDRTNRARAPEPLVPTNRFGSVEAALARFRETRARTLAILTSTPDLRAHAIDSPLGKKLDAYQWLLFISAHCERHTKQIDEVKADPNFPDA